MSPDIVSGIRRNWGALLGLALLVSVGPTCGSGGGGGGGGGGGPTLPAFNVVDKYPISTTPAVGRTQPIYLTVNGVPDPTTMNGTNIVVTGASGSISATYAYDPVLSQIVITPQGPGFLDSNVNHVVNVLAGLKTLGGSSMTPMTFSFTTVASTDTTLPSSPVTPAAGTTTLTTAPLTWGAASDNVTAAGALVYDVYVSTVLGQTNFAVDPVQFTAAGVTTITMSPLVTYTQYYFVIRTRDQAGNRDTNTTQIAAKTKISFQNDIYNAIVNNPATGHCTLCHTPGGMAAFMDLSTGGATGAHGVWVGVAAAAGSGPSPLPSCGGVGWIRVVANDTANSLVYEKISKPTPACGVRMPEDGPPYLTGTQITAFQDWINQGAPNN